VTTYRLKNSTVQAVHYTGQPQEQLPDFVRNYSAFSSMSGESKLGRNLVGNILVPHHGGYYTAVPGDWIVLEGKVMTVLSNKVFNERYIAESEPATPVSEDVVTITAQPGSPLAEAAKVLEPVGPAPTAAAPVIEPAPTAAAPVVEPAPTAPRPPR
jgi:hypothetical protein